MSRRRSARCSRNVSRRSSRSCSAARRTADGLPNTIREGQISNIRTIIDSGGGRGMRSMDSSIQEQFDAGNISAEEAYMKASDKSRFLSFLEEEEAAAKGIPLNNKKKR